MRPRGLRPLAEQHCRLPGIDLGPMFGTEGLRVREKVYAFVAHNGSLLVKLPEQRICELVTAGAVGRMIMRGRPMREWAEVPIEAGAGRWARLVEQARLFVDAITP